MKNQLVVDKTAEFIKQKFATEPTGHDWWHMYRVWQLAKHIASKEKGADMLVVELSALLHDIADFKFHDNDFEAGPKAARKWLKTLDVDEDAIAHIEDIIRNISFKGAAEKQNLNTLEGRIVHDADKLEAMGAIGIARVFAFSGASGLPIFEPQQKHRPNMMFKEYKKLSSSSINHFHEKLLLLRDRMFTKTGKELAHHRHEFMEMYLEEFHKEWDGEL